MIGPRLRAGLLFELEILESLIYDIRRAAGNDPRYLRDRNLDSVALAPATARRIVGLVESSGEIRERRLAHYPPYRMAGLTGSQLDSELGRRIAADARTAAAALEEVSQALLGLRQGSGSISADAASRTAAAAIFRLRGLVGED
jgi:hypothetical protein